MNKGKFYKKLDPKPKLTREEKSKELTELLIHSGLMTPKTSVEKAGVEPLKGKDKCVIL